MCFSDTPPVPTPPQEAKMADQSVSTPTGDITDARKKALQTGGAASSTLLTGPSGVENSSLALQRTTLLGQ